jgi:hypothetical protein
MMKPYFHSVRSPVRRPGADSFLLITLLSFALSVTLTRLFLWLTGYPQLGGGTLHIAHVLWGGLLLFVAALLPLIFANRWVYQVEAVLAGVGVGLFIDEVGKFITRTNDYFYQPAAPIIYAFFLVCVLVYMRFNKPQPKRARDELYTVLEMLEEVVDRDLDAREKADLESRLNFIAGQNEDPQLASLAGELLHYVSSDAVSLAPLPSERLKAWIDRFFVVEERFFDRRRARITLIVGLAFLGIASVANFIRHLLPSWGSGLFGNSQAFRMEASIGASQAYISWYYLLGVFHGLTGMLLVAGSVLLATRRENLALNLGYYALLIHLTILDLLMFYYYQFDTILFAILQFGLVLAVAYYRKQYVLSNN